MVSQATRRVVVIFGPPGSGKTTAALATGLPLYDRDDPRWAGAGGERAFRDALARLGRDPLARGVIVAVGLKVMHRRIVMRVAGVTEAYVMTTPPEVCIARVKARARGTAADLAYQLSGVDRWRSTYRGDHRLQPMSLDGIGGSLPRAGPR